MKTLLTLYLPVQTNTLNEAGQNDIDPATAVNALNDIKTRLEKGGWAGFAESSLLVKLKRIFKDCGFKYPSPDGSRYGYIEIIADKTTLLVRIADHIQPQNRYFPPHLKKRAADTVFDFRFSKDFADKKHDPGVIDYKNKNKESCSADYQAYDFDASHLDDYDQTITLIDAFLDFFKSNEFTHPFVNESQTYKTLAQYIFEAEA